MSIYDLNPAEFNEKLAEAVKKINDFKMPEWAIFVKTGVSKSRLPEKDDWWYTRVASILRQIYLQGVVGVNRLRGKYGSRKNRGMRPEIFAKASGKIIRVMLQQAERAGLVEKVKEGKRFGRKLSQKGRALLEGIK